MLASPRNPGLRTAFTRGGLRVARSQPFRRRLLHTTPPIPPASPGASHAAALASLTSELDKLAPRFDISAGQIRIIRAPGDFYSILKEKILGAKDRIFLSTLYIGASEHELIQTLRQALQNEPNLKVSVLSDALRGTRESPRASCASLLAPLVEEFGEDRVEIRMYHTPILTGLKKKFIPARLNEGWGLQHMKLYGIDDELILSGANLSTDYFTNRQDRYHIFSNKRITDYYASIQQAVSQISYKVIPDRSIQQGYRLIWPASNPAPQPTEKPLEFKACASALISPLLRPPQQNPDNYISSEQADTIVYPLGQFTPLLYPKDTSTEIVGLSKVLNLLTLPEFAESSWTFTAGYFNIHPTLKSILLASTSKQASIITAHPHANGFFGSAGISGNLPPGYTLLAGRFLADVYKAGKKDSIILREWKRGMVGERDGWTYHAKGIWINLPGEQSPSITLVGSSNYTRRSYSLDIEMNALVITQNENLKEELKEEVQHLDSFTTPKTLDDFKEDVGWRVKFLVWLFEKQL